MAHLQQVEESDTVARVAAYNARCRRDSDRVQLHRDPSGGGLICRAPLRVHWDVRVQLSLVESDGSEPLNLHYYCREPGAEAEAATAAAAAAEAASMEEPDSFAGVKLRRRFNNKQQRRHVIPIDWRRSSVRGHAFTGPSCVQPDSGQSVTVLADIGDRTRQVISNLFAKYLIRDPPDRFCLVVLAPDGWELPLGELDRPLGVRLSLGPDESRAGKLLVREAGRPSPRTSVLELARLPTPLLRQLLASIDQEEAAEVALTRAQFAGARAAMEEAAAGWRLHWQGDHSSHL